MKPLIFLCCEDIIRDAESDAISIHTIVEEINGEGYPVIIPKFCLFLLTQKEKGDKESISAKLRISNNDKELFSSDIKIDFQGKDRIRSSIKFGGLAIQNAGHLKMEFTIDTKLLAELTLPVNLIGQPKMHIS